MGTSSRYGGPSAASALVPSWLQDPADGEPSTPTAPTPASGSPGSGTAPNQEPSKGDDKEKPGTSQPKSKPLPPLPPPGKPGRFHSARANFTKFAKSNDGAHLRQALSDYVKKGAGGSRTAAQRMGSSSQTATKIQGLVRDIQQSGVGKAFAKLGIKDLAGQTPDQALTALTNAICPPGGTIDDGIPRYAWEQTLLDLAEQGTADITQLSPEQWNGLLPDFLARSIEARLLNDIGNESLKLPQTVEGINHAEAELHQMISGAVQDAVGGRVMDPLTYVGIWQIMCIGAWANMAASCWTEGTQYHHGRRVGKRLSGSLCLGAQPLPPIPREQNPPRQSRRKGFAGYVGGPATNLPQSKANLCLETGITSSGEHRHEPYGCFASPKSACGHGRPGYSPRRMDFAHRGCNSGRNLRPAKCPARPFYPQQPLYFRQPEAYPVPGIPDDIDRHPPHRAVHARRSTAHSRTGRCRGVRQCIPRLCGRCIQSPG